MMKKYLKRYLLYGSIGIQLEVFWTGLQALVVRGDRCLTANTSIIMFFIYGMVVFMEPLFEILKAQSWLTRGMVYGLMIFAMEFFCGCGLKIVHACPWDYSTAKYSILGVVRLDYYPLWILVGIGYNLLYKYTKKR